jgi:hypothetical protein
MDDRLTMLTERERAVLRLLAAGAMVAPRALRASRSFWLEPPS